ncbi:MAG: hypothetical protein EAZ67_07085, partial [Cytophagales bacterium]
DRYKYCKDGEQLDFKTKEELRAMLKSGLWRFVAKHLDRGYLGPGLDSLRIIDGTSYRSKLSFANDSVMSRFVYNVDSLGNETLKRTETLKYDLALSPQGKLAVRAVYNTTHPNGTPKVEYYYFYFCNADKLVMDQTYFSIVITLYNVYVRD